MGLLLGNKKDADSSTPRSQFSFLTISHQRPIEGNQKSIGAPLFDIAAVPRDLRRKRKQFI